MTLRRTAALMCVLVALTLVACSAGEHEPDESSAVVGELTTRVQQLDAELSAFQRAYAQVSEWAAGLLDLLERFIATSDDCELVEEALEYLTDGGDCDSR